MSPAGALRSTGITPLPHYYGPLRLPTRPTGSYGFPSVVDPDPGSPSRVSQVPVLICRRLLSRITPEDPTAACARCFAADLRLHHTRKVGHPHCSISRPKGSLAPRLTSSRSRAPTTRSPQSPPSRLHGERAISMVSTFQLTRSIELCLTHPVYRRWNFAVKIPFSLTFADPRRGLQAGRHARQRVAGSWVRT